MSLWLFLRWHSWKQKENTIQKSVLAHAYKLLLNQAQHSVSMLIEVKMKWGKNLRYRYLYKCMCVYRYIPPPKEVYYEVFSQLSITVTRLWQNICDSQLIRRKICFGSLFERVFWPIVLGLWWAGVVVGSVSRGKILLTSWRPAREREVGRGEGGGGEREERGGGGGERGSQ